MSRAVAVPEEHTGAPLRGADVVAKGLLTRRQLAGTTRLRLFPDIYVWEGSLSTTPRGAWRRASSSTGAAPSAASTRRRSGEPAR